MARDKLTDAQAKRVENRIKNILREKGYKQKEIAEKLDMDEPALSRKLGNANSFNLAFLYELAESMNVSIYDLLPDTLCEDPPEVQRGRRIRREIPPVSYQSLGLMLYQLRKQAKSPYVFSITAENGVASNGLETPHLNVKIYGQQLYLFFEALDEIDALAARSTGVTENPSSRDSINTFLQSASDSLLSSFSDTPITAWDVRQIFYYSQILSRFGIWDNDYKYWEIVDGWDKESSFNEYLSDNSIWTEQEMIDYLRAEGIDTGTTDE